MKIPVPLLARGFSAFNKKAIKKLENFTRDGINSKTVSLGAAADSSVTGKIDYVF